MCVVRVLQIQYFQVCPQFQIIFSFVYILVSSPKRFAHGVLSSRSAKRQNNDISSSRNSNRVVQGRRNLLRINSLLFFFSLQVISPVTSSSEDEEGVDVENPVSLNRLFKELQNAQANIANTRTDNHGIHQQLTKLTKKMSQISGLLLSVYSNQFLFEEKNVILISSVNHLEGRSRSRSLS